MQFDLFYLCVVADTITCNLLQRAGPHVQHHGAVHDAAAQLKQTV